MKPSPGKRNEILIVDDTSDNLTILTQILTQKGYIVRPALSGVLALKAVQKTLPDLVLLDIMMPGIDGYEVCRQLKTDERTRDIPILFISALDEKTDKVKAFQLGAVDFITKPFRTEEVLARVKTQLKLQNMQKQLQEQNVQLRQEIQERKQMEEILQHRNRELVVLNQLGQMFSSSLELEHVLETALAEVQRLLDAFSTSFWLIAPETDELVCMHARGPGSDNLVNWRLATGQGISGWAVQHNESVLVADLNTDERHLKNVDEQIGVMIRSMMSILLQVKGNVIGVLNLVDPRVAHFTQNDVRFLEPIATEAAIAIENARLYTMAQQEIAERKRAEQTLRWYTWKLALLNKMSKLLQECHTEKETYTVVADTCTQIFPSDSGYIALMDDSQTVLKPVISWGKYPSDSQEFEANGCQMFQKNKATSIKHCKIDQCCSQLSQFSDSDNTCLCIPLSTSDEVLGIFSLIISNTESESDWKKQIETKEMIANRAVEHYALSLGNLRLRETLRIESIRDPLTGLYNRRYMEETLQQVASRATRRNTSVAIIMLDIDHFKMFNDTYGHEAGDVVLQELGTLLRKMFRGEDIACRYGGEEFLLILPEISLEDTSERAEQLLDQVRNLRITYQNTVFHITISVGVAALPDHGSHIQGVVSAADAALYQAKQQGRDQVVLASFS